MVKQKPLLILSGFLGSGKTTVLRQLLSAFDGTEHRVDVILNDYINAEIDSATLNTSSATTVSPIAAGCACCESLDELTSLCETAARSTGDALLLELNGTTDPLALLETFTLLEKRLPFFPRFQLCTIDARHWGMRRDYSSLEKRQLESAGFWGLTHTETLTPTKLTEVRRSIRQTAPRSLETNPRQLFQILKQEIERTKYPSTSSLPADLPSSKPALPTIATANKSTDHVHDAPHRLSHRFTGYQLRLPLKVRTVSMRRLLGRLPEWVLRAKALVKLVEEPGCRWLFEKVGTELIPQPLPVYDVQRTSSSLVCIGPQLDTEELKRLVETEFGTSW